MSSSHVDLAAAARRIVLERGFEPDPGPDVAREIAALRPPDLTQKVDSVRDLRDLRGVAYVLGERLGRVDMAELRSRVGLSSSALAQRIPGNEVVREAVNAVFLYHAIRAGLDMGIVNPTQLVVYQDIPRDLLERVEDVVLDRRPDATERLIEFSKSIGKKEKTAQEAQAWRGEPVEERLKHALVQGIVEIIRCVICLKQGYWPSREADVQEVDVDKLKEELNVKDEDIQKLDQYVVTKEPRK